MTEYQEARIIVAIWEAAYHIWIPFRFTWNRQQLVEMSGQDPLNLLDLAAQSLRNDKASAVRALEEHPVGLFPTLSTVAFDGGYTKTVTAMVQAWPFPCLHLGLLRFQSRTQDLLEAVLDGLELVPPHAAWPRRSKLKVLDFTHDSIWEECSEATPAPFVITHMLEEPEADQLTPSSKEQPQHHQEPEEMHTDLLLCGLFGFFHLSGFPLYILQRVERAMAWPAKPLETLMINGCRLIENDITYLSQSIHATRLKELVLCGNNLSHTVPGPLQVLLGEVSGTLQHLNLRSCRLKEAQLGTLLACSVLLLEPPLARELKELKCVQSPIPAECVVYLDEYRWGKLNRVELARVQAKLQEMLQAPQRADMESTNSTSVA
ncbi:unnamed protein product [Nyctereutes procyonoides]|uniref:Leucine-rich repeat-containing protein 14 n=1 Tax=Nyctereutes procyonoides TaxID=34880 RepID=A0A811Y967_NYCPR|nr:unnamed protein product [Nyctereutes procyonoides]